MAIQADGDFEYSLAPPANARTGNFRGSVFSPGASRSVARMSATLRASLAAEGFGTESGPTTPATAEERKTQRALEDAALDAAVAINQVHGFFGGCPCGEQGRYGRSVRPTWLLCRGWPKYKAQRGAERCLRG